MAKQYSEPELNVTNFTYADVLTQTTSEILPGEGSGNPDYE